MIITETQVKDISTIYAYKKDGKSFDMFSCFMGDYQKHKERDFIASIDSPEYSHYHISWSGCE